jgi:hypothetical protein
MADEQSTSGMVPGLVQDFIGQLRAITEGLEGLAGWGEHRPPAPGGFPLAGALSAAQLTSIASSVAAQRRSIEALKAQLSSFDEQLAVLEQILVPLAEWSSTWAGLEQRLMTMGREPPAQSPASGSLAENHCGRGDRPFGHRQRSGVTGRLETRHGHGAEWPHGRGRRWNPRSP